MAHDVHSPTEQTERYAYTAARFYLMVKHCGGPVEQDWAEETWYDRCSDIPAEILAQARTDHKAMTSFQEPTPPESP